MMPAVMFPLSQCLSKTSQHDNCSRFMSDLGPANSGDAKASYGTVGLREQAGLKAQYVHQSRPRALSKLRDSFLEPVQMRNHHAALKCVKKSENGRSPQIRS